MAKEFREVKNAINITGAVKEQKLELDKNKDGETIMKGSIVVKAGEFREVEVNVYTKQKTKKGTDNKTFLVLEKLKNEEIKTMANAKEDEEITKIRVFGNNGFAPHFKEDMFKKKDVDEVATKIKIDLGFGSVVIDNTIKEEDYKAEFDIEVYVQTIEEELDKEENETGRVKIRGWLPVYGGKVIPIDMIAGTVMDEGEEINIAEGIQDMVEEGSTFNAWGEINFEKIVEKVKKGGSIGKAKIETKNTYINELVITGGDVIEEEEKELDGELVKEAKLERDKAIEEKRKEEPKEEKKSKGLSKGGAKPTRERPKF
ncbi:hypothetical protein DVV91_10030 [Clostridium botulinum]|uniref:hypothetical protein n=1 Tax=Clostridium botulinum TaxID=1491 RepID=UPI0019673464|nr:hypothetical protein [Clostridium botulinum]MBN1074679.1 hypothetical protein [Clostridium botulinum]